MNCKKCNSENLKIIDSGPHKKLICADCNSYQKFLSKDEAKLFEDVEKERINDLQDNRPT